MLLAFSLSALVPASFMNMSSSPLSVDHLFVKTPSCSAITWVRGFPMGHRRLKPLPEPLDLLILITVAACLGPDGNGVYPNGIRISS